MFLSLCLFVTLWNYKVCDNENAISSVIFKTIMVSLHTGRFVVVHLYSTFSVDPHNFSLEANLYSAPPKLHVQSIRMIFADSALSS